MREELDRDPAGHPSHDSTGDWDDQGLNPKVDSCNSFVCSEETVRRENDKGRFNDELYKQEYPNRILTPRSAALGPKLESFTMLLLSIMICRHGVTAAKRP